MRFGVTVNSPQDANDPCIANAIEEDGSPVGDLKALVHGFSV
jgi:hypothetical protein